MKILILSATAFEVAPLREAIQNSPEHDIDFLEAGIGMLATCFKLQQWLQHNPCDLIIQAGIAGAFNVSKHPIGSVVEVQSERIGDLGALFPDGHFEDVFEIGLAHADAFPFQAGTLKNPKTYTDLVQVQSLSVDESCTQARRSFTGIRVLQARDRMLEPDLRSIFFPLASLYGQSHRQ